MLIITTAVIGALAGAVAGCVYGDATDHGDLPIKILYTTPTGGLFGALAGAAVGVSLFS